MQITVYSVPVDSMGGQEMTVREEKAMHALLNRNLAQRGELSL